jgi:hypothetical protein
MSVQRRSQPARSPEMESLSRVRTMATWLRKTGKHPDTYPKLATLTVRERFDASAFARGTYPWPARWTKSLVEIARGG